MARVTAQGTTAWFNGNVIGHVVGVQFETPEAEVVDMTGMYDPAGFRFLVPTGDKRGGTVTVDVMTSEVPASNYIGTIGELKFQSSGFSVSRNVLLQSASTEARTGELVRGTLKFALTDHVWQ